MPLDTAFVASRPGWLYCDDSRISAIDGREVVVRARASCVSEMRLTRSSQGRPAYVLYYRRVKT